MLCNYCREAGKANGVWRKSRDHKILERASLLHNLCLGDCTCQHATGEKTLGIHSGQ